jgi:hypothetical protein
MDRLFIFVNITLLFVRLCSLCVTYTDLYVYCTLTEGILYTDLYTVHWLRVYCTLTEGILYTDLYTVHWGYIVHWLRVYCTLSILHTDWGYTVHCLSILYTDWGFPCYFLSCRANAWVKLAKTGHGPHSSTLFICVVRLLFMLFSVLFVCKCVLPPGDNQTAVHKYIICSIYRSYLPSNFHPVEKVRNCWSGNSTSYPTGRYILDRPTHVLNFILLGVINKHRTLRLRISVFLNYALSKSHWKSGILKFIIIDYHILSSIITEGNQVLRKKHMQL